MARFDATKINNIPSVRFLEPYVMDKQNESSLNFCQINFLSIKRLICLDNSELEISGIIVLICFIFKGDFPISCKILIRFG